MGSSTTKYNKVNFEDIQYFINNKRYNQYNIILLHSLESSNEKLLIKNSIPANQEEELINSIIENTNSTYKMENTYIFIYGKNNDDNKPYTKYDKLIQHGFSRENIFIYSGGLFEWLLLQDIYTFELFPTNIRVDDFLGYKQDSLTTQTYKLLGI